MICFATGIAGWWNRKTTVCPDPLDTLAKRQRDRGAFTLVELLIVISIVVILVILVMKGCHH